MEVTETPEYFAGYEWAGTHFNELRERFSSGDIGSELRGYLFDQAMKLYPSMPGDMEREWKQILWVAGGLRFAIDKLPLEKDSLRTVWDMSLEFSHILGAERWKYQCWKELREKPEGWWRKKVGDASPNDVVSALAVAWRAREGKEKKRNALSKWEILVDRTGSREMCILSELRRIELVEDGNNWYYRVSGKENSFEMIMRPSYYKGRLEHGTGEIIG